jgi:hypothetical protein
MESRLLSMSEHYNIEPNRLLVWLYVAVIED